MRNQFIVKSIKYDNSLSKSWKAELVKVENSLFILKGIFDRTINHPILGIIRRGTVSLEYFWLDKWYNVFKFYNSDGSFRNYYCNINMLPVVERNCLTFVDLDMDILVNRDFSYQILDLDEFEENLIKYAYPVEIIEGSYKALNEIISLITNRDFPFR